MNWVTGVTAVMAIAAPLLGAYVLIFEISGVQHSKFRHQLWALRDDVVDDVLAGRLRRDRCFRMLMALVESGIADVDRHTMMAAALGVRHTKHLVPHDLVNDVILGGEAGPERARLAEYLERYRKISERHLVTGAPSGWVYWLAKRTTRQKQGLPAAAVDAEIAEAPVRGTAALVPQRPLPC